MNRCLWASSSTLRKKPRVSSFSSCGLKSSRDCQVRHLISILEYFHVPTVRFVLCVGKESHTAFPSSSAARFTSSSSFRSAVWLEVPGALKARHGHPPHPHLFLSKVSRAVREGVRTLLSKWTNSGPNCFSLCQAATSSNGFSVIKAPGFQDV